MASHHLYDGAASALVGMLADTPPGSNVSVPDTLVGMMFSHFVMDIPTSTVERFVESGGLNVIDDEVAGSLGDGPAVLRDAMDDQVQLRVEVQNGLLLALARAENLTGSADAGRDALRHGLASMRGDAPQAF